MMLMVPFVHAKSPDPTPLRYAYPQNQTALYKNNSYTDIGMSGMSILLQSEWMSHENATQNQDTLRINTTYKDISESILVSSQLIQQPIFSLLDKKPFSFSITQTGDLTQFTPPKPNFTRIDNFEIFEMLITSLEFIQMRYFPELPPNPVTIGDTWTSNRTHAVKYTTINIDGTLEETSTYTIKKIKKIDGHACFEIEIKSQTTARTFTTLGELSFIEDGTTESKGKMWFDFKRGLILKYELKGKAESEATILDGSNHPPVKAKAKITIKRELKSLKGI